ncbi:RNI-like protein [Lepidopterella palustris CBS 459.81]|uniref:RNI-like protein n=1 Tax=Lepidopterella palustris CBS 459.81 TaxID=1314670 RepID=A0A8E2J8X1_9PEZI|nr:RNI-like protein [Lepidopterella palustris CBS 459.81]
MSGRRAGNRIRGPHSALTDFLAANNISAAEIRDSYRQRVQQAAQNEGDGQENGEASIDRAQIEQEQAEQAEAVAQAAERSRKRKRNQEEAIAKVKKSKELKRKASKKSKRGGSDDSDDEDYNELDELYKKAKPLPGQLENCEVCSKRFTVTPYSKTGPDGGLVCTPCGKELTKDSKASEKAKKPVVRKTRRKLESNRLDGLVTQGAKSLQQLCIEKVAQHHLDIEEFGDLPEGVLNRLSEIFSKNRVLNPRTMNLFLRPDLDTVAMHECANLQTEDYSQIFAIVPNMQKLVLRNCCQFKDENMEYMIEKATKLKHIQLYAANLVTNDMWINLFVHRAKELETLKLEWLDAAFDDQAVEAMVEFCPNISRLKLRRCRQLGVDSIDAISRIEKLEHLSLHFNQEIPGERLINLLGNVGLNLRTLSLERFLDASDEVLSAIHSTCRNLVKMRFTQNDYCTDAGYVSLFNDWANPPLQFADFSSNRDIDNSNPEGPEDAIGFASAGFAALMAHSGSKLKHLDINSCRHITHAAFSDVFDGQKQYPCLQEINLSFCTTVDTVVVAGIFRSCPALKKVVAFGCFTVEDVVVPRGIVLIGVPKAQDAIEQFGDSWLNVEQALGAMVEVGA